MRLVRPAIDLLPLMPVVRDDETWTYRRTDTNHQFSVSCTQLLAFDQSLAAAAAIEASRHIWQPRGNGVHAALEAWLLHGTEPDPADTYIDWILPLLSHEAWQRVTVIGIESRMFDMGDDVAGTGDVLVRYEDGTVGAWDLKTKESKRSSRQDVKPQLGFATRVLMDHYRLLPSRCVVLWSYLGQCQLTTHTADECHMAWQDRVEAYDMAMRQW